jgi:hypothetical protein
VSSAWTIALLVSSEILLGACRAPSSSTIRSTDPVVLSRRGQHAIAVSAERRGLAILSKFDAGDPVNIDPRKSLAVTDLKILDRFSFAEVIVTLAGQAGATPPEFFAQWWNTQDGPGPSPKCWPVLFEFPYRCPRAESTLATDDPLRKQDPLYIPIGLFNRIDLADPDGSDCGEYRIVFARRFGPEDARQVLINFEAVLPNPEPARKVAGCKPVAEFWRDLSSVDVDERARRLHDFYFTGLPKFLPIVHVDNYGLRLYPTGQIRTNQFMEAPWLLREFRLARDCEACPVAFHPSPVAQNPFGGLFGRPEGHRLAPRFQDAFVQSVSSLITGDVNRFTYAPAAEFNSGQSESCDPAMPSCQQQPTETNYKLEPHGSLKQRIQAALGGTPGFTPEHVVERAKALSCAGCHQLSNSVSVGGGEVWPPSAGFVHVTERATEPGPDGKRYLISDALRDRFLPHREGALRHVLAQP